MARLRRLQVSRTAGATSTGIHLASTHQPPRPLRKVRHQRMRKGTSLGESEVRRRGFPRRPALAAPPLQRADLVSQAPPGEDTTSVPPSQRSGRPETCQAVFRRARDDVGAESTAGRSTVGCTRSALGYCHFGGSKGSKVVVVRATQTASSRLRWKRLSIERVIATNGVPLSVISSCGTPHSSIASSSRPSAQTASLVGTARIPSRNRL